MAISISTPPSTFIFLLLILTTLPAISSKHADTWTVPPQIRNIIEALINAGNFGSWANVLLGTNPSSFPLSATLFIPSDDALAHLSLRPIVDVSHIQYHIIPHHFAFYDLQQFQIGARISTLLPNKTIAITNNTRSNFTVDDSLIIYSDIYNDGVIAVHGIGSVLNSSLYGSTCTTVSASHDDVESSALQAASEAVAPCEVIIWKFTDSLIFVLFVYVILVGCSVGIRAGTIQRRC